MRFKIECTDNGGVQPNVLSVTWAIVSGAVMRPHDAVEYGLGVAGIQGSAAKRVATRRGGLHARTPSG